MTIRSAMQSGVMAARDSFNRARTGAPDNQGIFKKVNALAEALCEINDVNGYPVFTVNAERTDWGHTLIVQKNDTPEGHIEFEFFAGSDLFTAYVPRITNPLSNRLAVEMTTEQEALEALAHWAGRSAPELQRQLAETIERFEHLRCLENDGWHFAPTHY